MKKLKKSCISFLWMYPIPWLCIFKMQNHPSKLGIHWWRCIAPIHKPTKCSSSKSCIIYKKNKMNISDYSTKVKNLTNVLTSIGAHTYDEDLVAVTLNELGKDYSQFFTSIAVWETFPNFQYLITLLLSEEMRVIGTSSNGGSQESVFYSNINRGKSRDGKTSFRGGHESSHEHHQHEGQLHGGGWGNFGGRGSCGGCGGSHQGQQPNSNSNCYYYGKPGLTRSQLL